MVDDYPYALASDFAVNRILKEAPESFHKLDNDDVIQVYMDLFGTDPADDMGMNRGGMMNINRMTKPLGYALGGPAGMTQDEFIKAQMIQEDDPRDLSKLSKFDQFISDRFPVDPRFTAKEEIKDVLRTGRDIGSKGLEGIKKLGSKSLGAIKYAVEELIGAGPAEGSESYISPGEAKDMSTEDLEKEIHGFNPYEFGGQGYSWKNLRTIQIVIDELMSRLGDD